MEDRPVRIVAHRAQCLVDVPARFGVELDLHHQDGKMVLSHDPPGCVLAKLAFDWFLNDPGTRPFYCLNIKTDGIEKQVAELFERFPYLLERGFAFDASYPTTRKLLEMHVPCAGRCSDEELADLPEMRDIWLDRWRWRGTIIWAWDTMGDRRIHAVSRELHHPDSQMLFVKEYWGQMKGHVDSICTDYPQEAEKFFETGEE